MTIVDQNVIKRTGFPSFKEGGGTSIAVWIACAGCDRELFYGNLDGDATDWPAGKVIESALIYCAKCQAILNELGE